MKGLLGFKKVELWFIWRFTKKISFIFKKSREMLNLNLSKFMKKMGVYDIIVDKVDLACSKKIRDYLIKYAWVIGFVERSI